MSYSIVTERGEDLSKIDGPAGHRLQHSHLRFGLFTVPIPWIPIDKGKGYLCPTCQVTHMVKTIHLQLDSDGTVIVSQGVYERLKKAGLETHGLTRIGTVLNPPTLGIARGKTRAQIDAENRKITVLGQPGRTANG